MDTKQQGACPSCGAEIVIDMELCTGFWDGECDGEPINGVTYSATCQQCGKELIAYEDRDDIQASDLRWGLRNEQE